MCRLPLIVRFVNIPGFDSGGFEPHYYKVEEYLDYDGF
jgi:hypothetical protein